MNGSNEIGDIVSKLAENPEMMKTLMGIAGKLKNSAEEHEKNDYGEKNPQKLECKEKEQCEDADRGVHHRKNRKGDDAENLIRLLLALKPYVGTERCDKIDGIIKILKFVQLSEKTGLFGSFL